MAKFEEDGSIIAAIREFCGPEIAEKVLAGFGGRRIDIPRPELLRRNVHLVHVLGWDDALKVCQEIAPHGTLREIIPLQDLDGRLIARRSAVKALLNGASVRTAASLSGLHERTIFRLRKKLIEEGRLSARGRGK